MRINGSRVRELRIGKGLSQQQLADIVGLQQAGLNAIEHEYTKDSGAFCSTSVEKFAKLVVALETTADDLLYFDDAQAKIIKEVEQQKLKKRKLRNNYLESLKTHRSIAHEYKSFVNLRQHGEMDSAHA